MIYVYDGAFEGLLTLFSVARESGLPPRDIATGFPACDDLFCETAFVVTDHERAVSLAGEVRTHISSGALKTFHRAFLADSPGREVRLWSYLALGWRVGGMLDAMVAHDYVLPVHRLAKAVMSEAHRMKGFVRFRELRDGFYYAPLEPLHDILPLIGRHFADRFHDQHWLIHDLRRRKALIHDASRQRWLLTSITLEGPAEFSRREAEVQALWRCYFEEVGVAERRNLRLQKGKVPLRYRGQMVEF